MKKLIIWTKEMRLTSRYISIDMKTVRRLLAGIMIAATLCGCSAGSPSGDALDNQGEESSFVDVSKLREFNGDIFAWIRVPDTNIDYPVLQSADGDDSFYATHDYAGKEDPKGAIYIEAANIKDMCDFNEVLHGSSPSDGTMFAILDNFLDRTYFESHRYIYVDMEGNALMYYTVAACTRDNTRLLEDYDFSYAVGCEEFLDEIYSDKSMNKVIRSGWEDQVRPDNFIITLSTVDQATGKQVVVVGCLVGDVAGKIDRFVDYSDPEE